MSLLAFFRRRSEEGARIADELVRIADLSADRVGRRIDDYRTMTQIDLDGVGIT